MAAHDLTELLASIRRKAIAPDSATNTGGWDDTTLTAVANEQLLLQVAQLVDQREGYKVATKDLALVAAQAAYPVPQRAVLGKVRAIQLVDSTGKVVATLNEIRPDDLDSADITAGQPASYYFQDSDIIVFPVPSSSNTSLSLRITYYRRANRLIAPASAGVITGIALTEDTTLVSITIGVTAASLGFTTSTPLDVVGGKPHFRALMDDATPSQIVSNAILFSGQRAGLRDSLAVGDYVCLAGYAPVPQIPVELHQVLARRVANAMLNGADAAALEQGAGDLAAAQSTLDSAATPRNEAERDQSSSFEFLDP